MEERAFASANRLAGEIRDRRIGCLELLDVQPPARPFADTLQAIFSAQPYDGPQKN